MVTYDVYVDAGDSSPETLVCADVFAPGCDPGILQDDTLYFWQVLARDVHSATTQGPVWSFSTAPTSCVEAVANGGFETSSDWEIPATAYPAAYSSAVVHSGSRSMRVGIVDPVDRKFSYSSARQAVSIPLDATSATLGFWLYAISGDATSQANRSPVPESLEALMLASDAQYVLVLDQNDDLLETLLWQTRDDQEWIYHEFDLLGYRDETIKLQFGVKNDAEGGVTGMYVDDVTLLTCGP
jgi:hypothetical protein